MTIAVDYPFDGNVTLTANQYGHHGGTTAFDWGIVFGEPVYYVANGF